MPDRYPGRDWVPTFPPGYRPRAEPALYMGPSPDALSAARRAAGAQAGRVAEGDKVRRALDRRAGRTVRGGLKSAPAAAPRPQGFRPGSLIGRLFAVLAEAPAAVTSRELAALSGRRASDVTADLAHLKARACTLLRWGAPVIVRGRVVMRYWHACHDAAVRAALNIPADAARPSPSESEDTDAQSL